MKRGLWVVGLLAATIACQGRRGERPAAASPSGGARAVRTNVLLVTIDTLRADHLGTYGYRRATSPRIDALAARGVVFERAFTLWPKTRASMIAMLTGLYPSRNGYDQQHRELHGFNPTLASVLKHANYATAAVVDNANLAAALGFGKGFDRFREIWTDKRLKDEAAGARAITDTAVRLLRDAPRERPFFLWLHYVNPHAPYTPPPPFDAAFRDDAARGGGEVRTVVGFNGGVSRKLAVPGQNRLGYYVSQYDGEIAFTDGEVGRVLAALAASGHEENTLVVLTSDHGESLGEHNYYFDHGADLFDPCLRVPLIIYDPRVKHASRSAELASTLDVVPTILDALKVSFPPELAGVSLLAAVEGRALPERQRLFAENDRGLVGTHDGRFKLIRDPAGPESAREALFDRSSDRAEERDLIARQSQEARRQRTALDAYLAERSQEWAITRLRLGGGGPSGDAKLGRDDCLRLLALGYVDSCP